MTQEEFDRQELEKLLDELKDIDNYTGFKDGAFVYYLGKYKGSLLVQEIERLRKIINIAVEELENIPVGANGGQILDAERNIYHILKEKN